VGQLQSSLSSLSQQLDLKIIITQAGLQALIRFLKPRESNFCGGKYHSGLSNKIVVMVLLAVAGPTTSMETLIVLLQPLRV
jgi:hypothetical protein